MKSHDELTSMAEDERLAYLDLEVERLIAAAAPRNQLKMRALQAKCDAVRRKYKNPIVACGKITGLMEDKFFGLNDALLLAFGRKQ
jgi:hypothetical protein